MIEVVGHDHYSDLRYHSSQNVCDLADTDVKFDFHNILIAPGITPIDSSNPGVTMFEIDENLLPKNLRMEFLNLGATIGNESFTPADADWWSVDFASAFNLTMLDPSSLATFRKFLEAPENEEFTVNYLVSKLGFDPSDPTQF